MSTEVIGLTSSLYNAATTSLIEVPEDVNGEPVQEGDLLLFALVVADDGAHDGVNFLTAMTLPAGWSPGGYTNTTIHRVIFAFKYVSVGDPSFYTFGYVASVHAIGLMIAVRGAVRDFNPFTPGSPPNFVQPDSSYFLAGFFAPSGSSPSCTVGLSTSMTANNTTFPTTATVRTRVMYFAANFGSPSQLDDPLPLVPIVTQLRLTGVSNITLDVLTVEVPTPSAPPPNFTIRVNISNRWIVVAVPIEPADERLASEDNYKGKLMRQMLHEPWDARWGSAISDVLTVIGSSDNDIGGLFGDDDFLPNGDE